MQTEILARKGDPIMTVMQVKAAPDVKNYQEVSRP
jgi:hypothetical protein